MLYPVCTHYSSRQIFSHALQLATHSFFDVWNFLTGSSFIVT